VKLLSIKNIVNFIILVVVIYTALIFFGDYQKIFDQLKLLNVWVIPIVMFFAWSDDFLRFFKWDYFLRRLNIKIERKMSFLIFFSGLSMSITPGKVGEVLKSYLLKKSNKVKMRRSISVVVFERLTDILGLAILAMIGAFTFVNSLYFLALIMVLIISMISALGLLSSKRLFYKASKLLIKMPVVKNYVKYIDNIYKNSRQLLSPKILFLSTLLSVFSWSLECIGFYILLYSLGSPLSFTIVMFIFSFSSIFGSVIFLPGGLGAAESSFVALLVLSGLTLATASLATILIRLCTLFWGIFLGIVCFYLTNRIIEKSK
jgi:uncharacterized protein (TIRG00374 family)